VPSAWWAYRDEGPGEHPERFWWNVDVRAFLDLTAYFLCPRLGPEKERAQTSAVPLS
jgi:hypothetical protein